MADKVVCTASILCSRVRGPHKEFVIKRDDDQGFEVLSESCTVMELEDEVRHRWLLVAFT